MSPVSATIPTAIASATPQPRIMSANAMTTISTMLSSTMVTVVQPAPSMVPTVSATTVYLYSQEPPSTASTSDAPRQWIPEPYNSIIMFIAAVAGIIYLFGYTFPHTKKNIIKWFRRKKIRAEQLFKKREEKEEKREKKEATREEEMTMVETRTYQVHQMQSVENLVNGQHAHVEETKGIRESVEKVATGVQVLPEAMMNAMAEVIKGAVKEGYENGAKDAMKGMEEIITKAVTKGTKEGYEKGFKDAMKGMEEVIEKAVTKGTKDGIKDAMREVNQETRKATREGMKRVEKSTQEIEHTVHWVRSTVEWVLHYCTNHSDQLAILSKSCKHEVGETDWESETTSTMEIEDPIDAGSEGWKEEDKNDNTKEDEVMLGEKEEKSEWRHDEDDDISTTSTAPTLWDYGQAEDQSPW